MSVASKVIPEPRLGGRLGRHIEHDPRSRDYSAARATARKTVIHTRHVSAFDQGNLGSCTGNAMAGLLMTEPYFQPARILNESDAVLLYEAATHLDAIPGAYPPDDTGSTGLAIAKAAKARGWVSAYQHAFGLDHALDALVLAPGIIGIDWMTSFDQPLPSGECPLAPNATVRGGHEIQMFGIDVEKQRVWCYQSWGPRWGGLGNGTFWFSWDTFGKLLAKQGDVTFVKA